MPKAAARDYRCSWEVPYDFHPRIRAYPGVTSVVRSYMDGKAVPADPESRKPSRKQSRAHKERQPKMLRHYRLRPSPPSKIDVTVAQVVIDGDPPAAPPKKAEVVQIGQAACQPPSAPRPPRRRPLRRVVDNYNTKTIDAPAAAVAARRGRKTPSNEGGRLPEPQVEATESRSPAIKYEADAEHIPRRRPLIPSHFTPLKRDAPAEVTPATRGVVPVASVPIAVPPLRPVPPTHTSYCSRTKLRYTLPPSYSAQLRDFEDQPVPTISVRDRYTLPPSLREVRIRRRRVRSASRSGFVQELLHSAKTQARSPGAALPQSVLDSYLDASDAENFNPAAHNFNAVYTDAYESSVAERAAALQATERRMWKRLIARVAPLDVAHREAISAGGVSVMDSGHVSEPICITGELNATDARSDGGAGASEEVSVVVYPFIDELPATVEDVRHAELHRRLPKGREWDRQAAIRSAVGATAQEALLDLGLDPRYRQPGDLLLQRSRSY
ncbi:hypothetical protein ABL78_7641 [Leptomonas seymouri]|uniref:Uncharacterized protein n=1 Tax=Leptomonas seymouri TaxID=5684 RepID=A0A0N1HTQ4_LEPSE|nr:hypothetical protein ABL78_7641 [Leptomonas seymouri]|eukprot:KPI83332.1 hypothetical protein ABL78_7641 [Leptomonas seymouri]